MTDKDTENIFFSHKCKQQIKIGDYFYKDGTLSHEYQNTKECIGIIFSRSNLFKYPNWSVVALTDAIDNNNLHLWYENNNIDNQDVKIVRNQEILKKDYGGLFYVENNFNKEYNAIQVARNYPIDIPMDKTSGWYLPSSGQMWQIARHFYNNNNFVEQSSILNLADVYMVSQAREIINPLFLDLNEQKFSCGKINDRFLVRPVFSF